MTKKIVAAMFSFFSKNPSVDELLEKNLPGFYVYDLEHIETKYKEWVDAFPRIVPFYAMKANPHPTIIKTLVRLGAGIDCASATEITTATSCGASNIIFAHPCKIPADIRHTRDITLTTVDSESELVKIAMYHPKCKILIRIQADDPTARHPLGSKFGCEMIDVPLLLGFAQKLQLNVVGVAFHVGSGSSDPKAYERAIQNAKYIYDTFTHFGMTFEVLDIGGGFCGRTSLSRHVVDTINTALDMHFPYQDIRIIAEPGRFFVEKAGTLYVQVIGSKKDVYYIADGVYGNFNPLLTRGDEYKLLDFTLVRTSPELSTELRMSSVFGPTCDANDLLLKDIMIPRMNVGDYLRFNTMGAYSIVGCSNFNGYSPTTFPVYFI
jgi:ornithine decarboxylase